MLMKTRSLIAAAALLAASCNEADHKDHSANADSATHNHGQVTVPSAAVPGAAMQLVMDSMMQKMHTMKMSGDVDRDFAEMMILHHQGAIDMAKAELAGGTDSAIRGMAKGIISAQQGEIAEMRDILKSLPAAAPGKKEDASGDALMQSMEGMMDSKTVPSGNMDKDFVNAMIPHHNGAVEMAKVELQYGRDQKLKAMAQKMIDDQNREIAEMKAWLQANP